jgi:8-oxo-dGTP pyrophosphatase MutT (NUDIX family)
MLFAAGNFVFPGGKLDPSDYAPESLSLVRGMTPERATRVLDDGGSPAQSLGHYLAAIRELFEETGILLCTTAEGRTPDLAAPEFRASLSTGREQVHQRLRTFASLLRELDLRYDPGVLLYLTRWITPVHSLLRFDTRFFLCQTPPGQDPQACPREVAETRWIQPGEALGRWRVREMRMRPPTVTTLMYLAQYPNVGRLVAAAASGSIFSTACSIG